MKENRKKRNILILLAVAICLMGSKPLVSYAEESVKAEEILPGGLQEIPAGEGITSDKRAAVWSNAESKEYQEADLFFELEKRVKAGLLAGESKIDISDLAINKNKYNPNELLYFSPYLCKGIDISCNYYLSSGLYGYITLQNPMSIEETKTHFEKVEKAVGEIQSQVSAYMTSQEKALVVHDYFASQYRYDYNNLQAGTLPEDSYRSGGLFLNRTGVCQAYAYGYKYIMNLLNIECYVTSSSEMNHAWNIIKIGNDYYHVDCTWDDPVYDRIGRVNHEYFLVSDNAMTNEREHYGWNRTDLVCSNTQYDNAYWVNVTSPIVLNEGYAFFVKDTDLCKYNLLDQSETVLKNLGKWYIWENPYYYYIGAFSGLFKEGDYLYYNTSTEIRKISIDGTKDVLVCKPEEQLQYGYIYGIRRIDDKIEYLITKDPSAVAGDTFLTPLQTDVITGIEISGSLEYVGTVGPQRTEGSHGDSWLFETYACYGDGTKALLKEQNAIDVKIEDETICKKTWTNGGGLIYPNPGWIISLKDKPGTTEIVVTVGEFSKTLHVEGKPRDISDSQWGTVYIKDIPEQIWTGKEITPEVEIEKYDNGYGYTYPFEKNKEFTVSYRNNINVGTATVELTGIGGYTGTITKDFQIVENPNQGETAAIDVNITEGLPVGTTQIGYITKYDSQGNQLGVEALTSDMIPGFDNKTIGKKSYTITCEGITKTIEVNIRPIVLNSETVFVPLNGEISYDTWVEIIDEETRKPYGGGSIEQWEWVTYPGNLIDNTKSGVQEIQVQAKEFGAIVSGTMIVTVGSQFTDVNTGDWYFDSVYCVYGKEIMTGMSPGVFAPAVRLSRAQFATILYRMQGAPEMEYNPGAFPDVPTGQFYTAPAMWAKETKVISGYNDGRFGAADEITREQMAVMMYRYANYLNLDTSMKGKLSDYPDEASVSGFAREALEWAVGTGLITGDGGRINPQGSAERAACATIIKRFIERYRL